MGKQVPSTETNSHKVTLDYAHLDQDNLPDYGIPWVPNTNVPLGAYGDQPAPVDFSNFYGLTSRDYEDTKTNVATGRVEHDFGSALSLRSILRAGDTKRDSLITSPRFESDASTAIRRTDWKSRDQSDGIVASQTDLTSRFRTGSIGHALVTGVEFAHETSEDWNRVERGGPAAVHGSLQSRLLDTVRQPPGPRWRRQRRHRAVGGRVWVNGLNIANERYIDRVGGGHFIPGPGRSVMLTADIGF